MGSVSSIKGDTMKFSVFEVQMIQGIFNQRGAGSSIKDIRLIDKTAKKLVASIPKNPEQPKRPDPLDKEKGYTPEETKEFNTVMQGWVKECQTIQEQEIEVELNNVELHIVKQKFGSAQFQTSEDMRERIIGLADKLGV